MQHVGHQQLHQHHKHANGNHQHNRCAKIDGPVDGVVIQQTQCLNHGHLVRRHPLAFQYNVLSLKERYRLHRIHGLLP